VGIGSWDLFPDLFSHRNSLKSFSFCPGALPISSELSLFEKIFVYIMGLFSRTAKQSSPNIEKALKHVLNSVCCIEEGVQSTMMHLSVCIKQEGKGILCGFFFTPSL